MAIEFVAKTAKASQAPGVSVTTAGLDTSAGQLIVLTHSMWRVSTPNTVSASDSLDNIWNTLITNQSGSANDENARATIAWCILANAGSGQTFTMTSEDGSAYHEMNASQFSGAHASPLDQQGNTEGGASATSATATTTGNLSENDELVIACYSGNVNDSAANISDPPTTGYTSIGVNQNASITIGYEAAYKILSGSGSGANQSAAWTFNSTDADGYAAVIATFKAAAGTPPITDGPKLVLTRSNIRLN